MPHDVTWLTLPAPTLARASCVARMILIDAAIGHLPVPQEALELGVFMHLVPTNLYFTGSIIQPALCGSLVVC